GRHARRQLAGVVKVVPLDPRGAELEVQVAPLRLTSYGHASTPSRRTSRDAARRGSWRTASPARPRNERRTAFPTRRIAPASGSWCRARSRPLVLLLPFQSRDLELELAKAVLGLGEQPE